MTSRCYMGIDLGTSSVKVALLRQDGVVIATGAAAYSIDRPRPAWAESDPAAWWGGVRTAVASAMREAPTSQVVGVGLSGQMHGVVLVDEHGAPVRPAMLWPDGRATEELAKYRRLPTNVLDRLGNPLVPGMCGPLLAWTAANAPEAMAAARWALQPKDWIRQIITGAVAGDHSDASATLLYDISAQSWDVDVAESLGVDPSMLPPLHAASGDVSGMLTAGAAAQLGLPAGVPVAAGAADTAAAALGAGLHRSGDVQLTLGTGVQIITPVGERVQVTSERPVTHLHRDTSTHGWYRMAAALNGGQALDWVRRVLGADWTEVYASAGLRASPDAPLFLPHLSGERTPHLDSSMRGAWTGLGAHHGRTDLLRAAVEGVTFAIAEAFDALPRAVDGREKSVRLAGGGTRTPAFQQLLADALGAPLAPVDVTDASVRGASLLGAIAAGDFTHDAALAAAEPRTNLTIRPSDHDQVRERRTQWRENLRALRDVQDENP